jgi:hypothetical protein
MQACWPIVAPTWLPSRMPPLGQEHTGIGFTKEQPQALWALGEQGPSSFSESQFKDLLLALPLPHNRVLRQKSPFQECQETRLGHPSQYTN